MTDSTRRAPTHPTPERPLLGTVSVVTGASSGIGARTALALARRGSDLVITGRDRDRLHASGESVSGLGVGVATVEGDVALAATADVTVDTALTRFQRVDFVFANAGFAGPLKPLSEHTEAEFDAVVATNLRGVFLTMRAALPVMAAQQFGSFLVTASLGSERGLPGAGPYAAAKHGVLGLMRTAAVEYGPAGVRSNALLVGFADTPLLRSSLPGGEDTADATLGVLADSVALGRLATTDEVAEAACFFASDAARYVTGAVLPVDGGLLSSPGGVR